MSKALRADANRNQISRGIDDRFKAIFDSVNDGIFILDPGLTQEITNTVCP